MVETAVGCGDPAGWLTPVDDQRGWPPSSGVLWLNSGVDEESETGRETRYSRDSSVATEGRGVKTIRCATFCRRFTHLSDFRLGFRAVLRQNSGT